MYISSEEVHFDLSILDAFETIVIQCHDNPDADAIASGFALYTYLHEKDKNVRLIYTGALTITKPNLLLMLKELMIPLEYVTRLTPPDLLITVDCQLQGGNVTYLDAHATIQFDHHMPVGKAHPLSCIQPNLGSCSTLIWHLLSTNGFDCNAYPTVGTALYYGLMTDTNFMTELRHTLDKQMGTSLVYDAQLLRHLKNSNLSMSDLETAGIALIRCSSNRTFKFAILEAQPCDPNILGFISDLAIQVDNIFVCIVFYEDDLDIKFSIRSCTNDVKANEFAAYISSQIGSGGGHIDKAGGLISSIAFHQLYPLLSVESYLHMQTKAFFKDL